MTEIPAFSDFRSYQLATRRTVQEYLSKREREYQNMVGVIGEITEVTELLLSTGGKNEVAIIEEMGDVLWYLSRLLDDLDLNMKEVAKCEDTISFGSFLWVNEAKLIDEIGLERVFIYRARNLLNYGGKLTEHLKKYYFQQHDLNLYDVAYYCRKIMYEMSLVAFLLFKTMEDVAEANIKKSRKRYPNGWDTNNSIYRIEYMEHDLDCE